MWRMNNKRLSICRALVSISAFVLLLGSQLALAVQAGSWPIGWIDQDSDCQDTEVEVLVRDAAGLLQWGDPEACTIASGTWRTLAFDLALPMDSILVIPLVMPGNAEASGAKKWDKTRKREFLNDMDNLIILDVRAAQVRADLGPEAWQPHEKYRCLYATRWQQVKQHYKLKSNKAERAALETMLATCKAGAP